MITLKTLKWSNCFSYGEDNELDLSDSKLTQILGSNGVGRKTGLGGNKVLNDLNQSFEIQDTKLNRSNFVVHAKYFQYL